MEKKGTIICIIAIIILVAGTSAFIIFSGLIAQDYNYVQLEVNPRIEFLCDKKFNVVSVYPLNNDARIVISDLDLIGLNIEDASRVFLDECAKTGYIDVNGVNNSTNITVIDGITQRLDVHVTKSVYDYYRENEIMSAVTETYEDRKMFDEKKKNHVNCSNKYKLIKTISEIDENATIESLRKKTEVELVDMVENRHQQNPYTPTEEELLKKQNLILQNNTTYSQHINAISDNTQKEFSTLFDKFQKESIKEYQ